MRVMKVEEEGEGNEEMQKMKEVQGKPVKMKSRMEGQEVANISQ